MTRTGFALASETSDHCTHFQMLVEDEEGRELIFDVPQVCWNAVKYTAVLVALSMQTAGDMFVPI